MHISGMTTNGRSASENGTAGYQDISGADLVRMLTQDQAKADHSGPVGSHGITSSSVMGPPLLWVYSLVRASRKQ